MQVVFPDLKWPEWNRFQCWRCHHIFWYWKLLQEKPGSSWQCSKELQISKSISMQAEFISDIFSWKRNGSCYCEGEMHRVRPWQGVRVARASGTYIVGRMGVKKLHIDWLVKVMSAFLGSLDYPNLGMCGGLLAWILSLLQTAFGHLVVK